MTPNQYSDTLWGQNEITVQNLHLTIGFCEIGEKFKIIIVKNHKKPQKKKIFDKNQKLTTNYWHLMTGEPFLYMWGKNCIQDAIYT